jgi:diguanylate cyclase (GGDEF)-like protein/PAS domain S-box-containing protein
MTAMSGNETSSRDPIRILMLEDNPADIELITRRLDKDGLYFVHRVVCMEHDFRRELAEFSPQVILSDFSLPQFDGLSALKIARAQAASTPFIFVSGTIGEERAIDALKGGASDYVLKENLRRLVPALQAALRQADISKARDLAEEMLRRSESRLQDIIDTSADWIWECDADGRFTFSSPSVADILGYRHHELLGRPSSSYLGSADLEQLEAAFDEARSGRTPGGSLTLRWKHKAGKTRWLERKMMILRDDDGKVRGFRGIDRDVTMRKTHEARIARLYRALRFLSGASSAIVRFRDRPQLLREACRLAVQIGGYGMATIYVRPMGNEDSEPIICRAVSRKQSDAERPRGEPLDGDGPVARALATAESVIIRDLSDCAAALPNRELLLGMGLRSCIALPLVIDGTAVGVVQLHSDEVDVFGDAELALLRQVTGNITFSLQYLHSKESAQYLEYFDTLTALANRSLYLQRLDAMIKSARQNGQGLGLLVLDLAGLTVINDGLGHHAGDLLLQLVAERLKNTFGDSNSLCHLGGGRYAVASVQGAGAEGAATILRERVDYLFEEPFTINDQELRVSIKAGFAHAPDDGEDAEALLQHAQTALDRAKEAGEHYLRHSPDMNAQASERLSITNRLRRAVAEQGFVLNYQAKRSVRTGLVEGVEALLRWPDSLPGSISPAVFVPMLESLGLIDAVGRWVIAQALSEGAAWLNGADRGVKIAVNVSPLQLKREEFVDEVLQLLDSIEHGPVQLELEVTESMLMAEPRRAGAMLSRLRASGVSVAIDDFGTGHSSLQILARLPVDVLKVDRSFVRELASSRSDRLIVQATIMLARSLGMKTVAEGVETQEQVDVLTELGCDMLQGFFIHRPAPAAELAHWLAALPAGADECARGDNPSIALRGR